MAAIPFQQKITFSISEFMVLTSLKRTSIFQEIKSGRLVALHCGRRTLIPVAEAQAWLERLRTPKGEQP